MTSKNKPLKKFRFITTERDEYQNYQSTRAAIIDALVSAAGVPTKLYRVMDDGSEELLFDSEKTKVRSIRAILEKAEKGGRS